MAGKEGCVGPVDHLWVQRDRHKQPVLGATVRNNSVTIGLLTFSSISQVTAPTVWIEQTGQGIRFHILRAWLVRERKFKLVKKQCPPGFSGVEMFGRLNVFSLLVFVVCPNKQWVISSLQPVTRDEEPLWLLRAPDCPHHSSSPQGRVSWTEKHRGLACCQPGTIERGLPRRPDEKHPPPPWFADWCLVAWGWVPRWSSKFSKSKVCPGTLKLDLRRGWRMQRSSNHTENMNEMSMKVSKPQEALD